MQESLIALVGMIITFAVFFGVVFLIIRMQQRKHELRAEVQTRLIDKFGSSQELIAFLESSGGREFVQGVQNEKVVIHNRAMAGIRKAIVLSFLGIGLVTIWGISDAEWVSWFGILFLALGVGYVVAAVVSMRLGRETTESGNAAPQI